MKKKIAFVLSGGGSRGALQIGALHALLEANIQPDIIAGTSAGAINGTLLAYYGLNTPGLEIMETAWKDAAKADLLPSNYLWLTIRALFNRAGTYPAQRIQDFFIEHGLSPTLRFKELKIPLYMIAADLNSSNTVVFGKDPEEFVLDGLLASTALPPWMHPLEKDGKFLIDGGVVSNLPIEPVLQQGIAEIIALNLSDPRETPLPIHGFSSFFNKLISTIEQRQVYLEKRLAQLQNVTVHYISLQYTKPLPIWDFQYTEELFDVGYQTTRKAINEWHQKDQDKKQSWLGKLFHRKHNKKQKS